MNHYNQIMAKTTGFFTPTNKDTEGNTQTALLGNISEVRQSLEDL